MTTLYRLHHEPYWTILNHIGREDSLKIVWRIKITHHNPTLASTDRLCFHCTFSSGWPQTKTLPRDNSTISSSALCASKSTSRRTRWVKVMPAEKIHVLLYNTLYNVSHGWITKNKITCMNHTASQDVRAWGGGGCRFLSGVLMQTSPSCFPPVLLVFWQLNWHLKCPHHFTTLCLDRDGVKRLNWFISIKM